MFFKRRKQHFVGIILFVFFFKFKSTVKKLADFKHSLVSTERSGAVQYGVVQYGMEF